LAKAKKQSFLGGAAVLAAAVAIVKLIGALYKIPLGNMLSGTGMGYFGTAYNIYSVLLTISTAGLPLALSKLVSEANTLGRHNQKHRIFRVALATFFVIGAVGTLSMFFFPQQLAVIMDNSQAWYAIKALSPAVVCVCCMSAFRGYTQGQTQMMPTAISQVIEALCKLLIGLVLVMFMVNAGYDEAHAAGGAILGVTVGTALALIYLVFNYRKTSRYELAVVRDRPSSRESILKGILRLGIPITLGSSVMSIITLVDNKLILMRLQDAVGFTEQMASWHYGAYFNTMNLYNLPSSFIVPITVSVIPAVAACLARQDGKGVNQIVSSSMRITALLAFPAGIGLCVLSGPILNLVYPLKPEEAAVGAPLLAVLGIASIFVCLMLLSNSILQAHGMVNVPIITMLAGGVVKIVTNWVLVGNPDINIKGAPVGTLLCFALIAILNFFVVLRILPKRPSLRRTFFMPAIAAGLMGVVAWGSYQILHAGVQAVFSSGHGLIGNGISVMGAMVMGVVVYAVLVVKMHIISKEDLSLMPKGEKIAKILRIQ
jgi:stage V sporulation protein B